MAINGRSAESVDAVVAKLLAEAPQRDIVAAPGDVTDEAGTDAVLSVIGHVDVLVNNLGIFGAEPALDITDDEWRRYFEVDVLAAVRLFRATLPGMKERGWVGCSISRATRRSSSRPR